MSQEWTAEESWERALARWLRIARDHAEAKARVVKAEHMRKATLSLAMIASGESSVAAQEREARVSDAYLESIEKLSDAVREELTLSARLEAGRLWFDMRRTEAATRRAEMTLR